MKYISILLTIAVLALPSFSQAPGDKRQEQIIQLEHRWLASLDNPQALQSILANDFVHVLPTGIITKQQQIDYLRAHPRDTSAKRSFQDLRVRIYGEVAIANGTVMAVDERGTRKLSYFTDVFSRRNGRWQAVNAQETPAQVEERNLKPMQK